MEVMPVIRARSCASSGQKLIDLVQQLLDERSVNRPFGAEDDLRGVGLTSLDMLNLVLAVEAEFDLRIPDAEITLANFRSVSAIGMLVEALKAEVA
jgi:acyl carrier protein